jgi:peptidyl-prolyl cis-trans isomerase SurA
MRIATTLLLGAAVLAGVSATSLAQDSGFKPVPAVPAVAPSRDAKPSDAKSDAKPDSKEAAVADASTAPAADAAPTADAAAGGADKSTVQEAKNNDAAVIDATTDKEQAADTDSVIATVNDETISDYELRQRVALYLALNGITQKLTSEQSTRIRGQILEVLESEKLELQEAVKKKITVSPVEVDRRLNAMMQEYHFSIDQLRQNLTAAGASEDALRSQITASIAWQKTVQDQYEDEINVTDAMTDDEMRRYAETANRTHYHVLEIFLPVDRPELNDKVKKDADEVERQLHAGGNFSIVARQFSQHPTAATGGDMGWISAGQLAPELDAALAKMDVGALSDPIRSTGGWYVLGLRERQEALGTKIDTVPTGPSGPAGTLPLARLLFPVNPRGPKEEINQIMTVAVQIQQHYVGCDQLDELHNKMTGTVYMNLGDAKLADLSPQIQDAMKNTHPGEAAAPFMSDAGVELIGRCDKRIEVKTAYTMPSREQVKDQLFQNQIATMARRYLRDLKREANIQVRDNTQPDALIR